MDFHVEPPKLILRDMDTGEVHPLHDPLTEIDVKFDALKGTMTLEQKLYDEERSSVVKHSATLEFKRTNSTLVNLEGLTDNSLLLTFKLRIPWNEISQSRLTNDGYVKPIASRLKLRILNAHFVPKELTVPILQCLSDLTEPSKVLQLYFPRSWTRGWETVALILLTYREINVAAWDQLAKTQKLQDVAGFNWAQIIEKITMPPITESSPPKTRRERIDREVAIAERAARLGFGPEIDIRKFPGLQTVLDL